ncbi:hypothetical protein BGZ68_000948 [Mortierella alpina]|nr:hypothetical protein BGZ68_000948 [Mortierella alpina]
MAVPNDASNPSVDKPARVILNLPTDRPRSTMSSADEAQWPIQLGQLLTQSLQNLAQEHDMDLSAILLAAWSAVLSRLSDQREYDIAVQGLVPSPKAKTGKPSAYSLLRIDLDGDPSVIQLLERLKRAQDSYDDKLDIRQVAFSFSREEELSAAGQEKRSSKAPEGGFNLELNLKDEGGQIVGIMSYAMALFDSITIERYVEYLGLMLKGMVSDATQLVAKIDIISPAERLLLLDTWNNQPTVHFEFPTIHQLFEDQVKRTPSAIALVHEDQEITYADLNARSNSLAHQLIQLGVRPDTRVAICVGRSMAMIVGMLAILKAGGAYVPLDPSHASGRLVDIFRDASPVCVVAYQAGLRSLGHTAVSSLAVVDPDTSSTHLVSNIILPSLNSRHLAYIIYTSGTTGKPKGVMIEHQGVVSCVATQQQTLQIQLSSRVTQFFSVAFDVSVLEIFGTLCFGGRLHLLKDDVRMDIGAIWRYVERHRITHVMLTPTVFQYCDKLAPLNALSTLILCGESLSGALVRKLHNLVPRGSIFNMYGPTETTMVTTAWKCSMDALQDTALIGRPLSNTTIYVLDAHGNPVPLGTVGEIFIGGIGVARGYLNRPDLTAEKFLADPFSGETGARMYKTGDLGKYLPDGNLMHLGRNDHQVKIRGFRIELGEIEARLHEHPSVSEAVVIALGEGSNKRLVAYVIMKAAEDTRQYMIPAAFIRLDEFPLTTNGKLDRRVLPSPGDNDYSRKKYEVPQGAVELALASIWSDLLNVKDVSRHDSFFALGGHSLLAIQMISRLHQLGHSISVRSLFDSPSLSALAQSVGRHLDIIVPRNLTSPNITRITPELLPLIELSQADIDRIIENVPGGVANIQDIYALSPLQDGVLFHHMMARSGDPYVLYVSMSFRSRNSLDRYLGAIQQVVKRHDSLRTAFLYKDLSSPAQVVLREAPLSVTELDLDPAAGTATEQLKQMFDPRCYRMDLTQAPLLRVVVARQVDGSWVLVELLHHLIGDHSTLEIMQSEIHSFLKGEGNSLPPAQPYRNLIAQARLGMSQEQHEEFFKEMLADIDTPSLPFGIAGVHGDGTEITESSRMLPQETSDKLRAQAKRLGVSVASLCHVAWALVVARTSGQQRVVFGTVLFGRMQAATSSDRAMGLFINTLPMRVDLDCQSVEESVRSTHSRLAALLEHEHASLALAQRCSSVDAGVSLFSSVLNYRHEAMPPENEETADGMKLLEAHERTNYPFCLSVEDYGVSLGVTSQVIQPFDADRVCGYMQEALEGLAGALEDNLNMQVSRVEVLSKEERQLLLKNWNSTEESYPDDICLHHLLEQQVERTPEAIAVVHENQCLSYTELNTRANSLAHQLIALGVQPDSPVAICVERSPWLIIGILAILKAGGAYVPMDPSHASDRLADILRDASPVCVVADQAGLRSLGEGSSPVPVIDPSTTPMHPISNVMVPTLNSLHLAYIIYTSGTTGKPKGVMIEHQGVVSCVATQQQTLHIQPSSRVTQFFSVAFDVSVLEIFSTLCFGGSLHLLKDDVRMDIGAIWRYVERHRITHVMLTPTVFQYCDKLAPLNTLSTLTVCGESLSGALVRKLHNLVPRGSIFNMYGPTETTVVTTAWKCSVDALQDTALIGRPLSNRTIYVLDAHGNPVPLGVVGEIFIGGIGVARGYLNRPDLTEEKFLADPFSGENGARMYKTGDLGKYLPDGNLMHLGRNDHQVKIRGFRIELGEIEARLREHPLVSEAVINALGEGSNKRLIAYVIMRKTADNGGKSKSKRISSFCPVYATVRAVASKYGDTFF